MDAILSPIKTKQNAGSCCCSSDAGAPKKPPPPGHFEKKKTSRSFEKEGNFEKLQKRNFKKLRDLTKSKQHKSKIELEENKQQSTAIVSKILHHSITSRDQNPLFSTTQYCFTVVITPFTVGTNILSHINNNSFTEYKKQNKAKANSTALS